MNRVYALLAEFETYDVPLEKVADKYFHMDYKRASKQAALQELPVPCYRAGSQKSPWLVSVKALADYLDEQERIAKTEWKKMNS